MGQFARVKHRVRDGQGSILPSTEPINDRPATGKGPSFRLNQPIMDFLHVLNPGEKEFRFVTGAHTGWCNSEWTTFPLAESVTMGGNLVEVLEQAGGFSRISGIDYFSAPPVSLNYFNAPHLIAKFSCIAQDGTLRKPSTGLDCYFPILTRGAIWMETSKLDFTLTTPPPLPPGASSAPVDARIVFRRTVARQRPDPNSPKNYVYDAGARVVVTEVSGGWAHVERGWVLQSDLVPA